MHCYLLSNLFDFLRPTFVEDANEMKKDNSSGVENNIPNLCPFHLIEKAIECWTSNFRKVFTLWSGVETFHSFHCVVMIWLTASLTLDPENLRLLGSSEPFSKSKKEFNTQRFHVICCVYWANTLISCFAENKNYYCFCGSQTRPCTLG